MTNIKLIGSAASLTLSRKSKPGDGQFACGKKGGAHICTP